jgi:hypothetical protein
VLPETDAEKTLRLRFEDLQRENERLRDARSAITSQLGPLPISAAIVAGLVSGFTVDGKAHLNQALAHWALAAFGLMVFVSMVSSILKPYRKLRDELEADSDKRPSDATSVTDWYSRMLVVEEGVRGRSKSGFWSAVAGFLPLPLPWRAKTLQTACDQEWKGLFLTKTLFVAVIVLLILARTQ